MIQSVKTLILEFVNGQGPGHIQEIHLWVKDFRPDVPQHTVRARLSEMSRSEDLEQKLCALGEGFYGLYEEDPGLCSIVSYPDRGPWGDPSYRGNCSGWLVKDLILRFKAGSVFDPAEGSGTVREVVLGLNQYKRLGIDYEGRDLKKGWDILSSPLPERQFDLVWYHPPYWDMIRYSDDPADLSTCQGLEEFEERLSLSVARLYKVLRPGGVLAVLIGDKRKSDRYFPLFRKLLDYGGPGELKAIIIKAQHHCLSDRRNYRPTSPFLIPIRHEYCLVFQKAASQAHLFQAGNYSISDCRVP